MTEGRDPFDSLRQTFGRTAPTAAFRERVRAELRAASAAITVEPTDALSQAAQPDNDTMVVISLDTPTLRRARRRIFMPAAAAAAAVALIAGAITLRNDRAPLRVSLTVLAAQRPLQHQHQHHRRLRRSKAPAPPPWQRAPYTASPCPLTA